MLDNIQISKAKLKDIVTSCVLILLILFSSHSYSDEIEDAYWQSVDCQIELEIQAYLNQYPQGSYVERAQECLATIAAQQQVEKKEQTPQSKFVEKIQLEVEESDEAAKLAQLIKQKLIECETHYKADRLTTGNGGNALECYRGILKQDPTQSKAITGIKRIEDRYVGWVERAIQNKDSSKAKNVLTRLKKVNQRHPKLSNLKKQIDNIEANIANQNLNQKKRKVEKQRETVRLYITIMPHRAGANAKIKIGNSGQKKITYEPGMFVKSTESIGISISSKGYDDKYFWSALDDSDGDGKITVDAVLDKKTSALNFKESVGD